jgi:hypothetical protein
VEHRPVRSTLSVLRTVLRLLENDPALRPGSATVLEFKRATQNLIGEIQSDHGISVESIWPDGSQASQDGTFNPIKNHL